MVPRIFRVFLPIVFLVGAARAADAGPYARFIAAAGNAEADVVRLRHLKTLAHQCAVDGASLPGLEQLIKFVERWDSPDVRLQFFKNETQRTVDFDLGVPETSPLQPIAAFYRARMLVWTCLEYGDIYPFPEKRMLFLSKARQLFEIAVKAFPENRIARMYLGEPIPPAKTLVAPASAPAWAVAQREALERLTDIIEWWIDHRLRPNGEYGGAWGDDCEMWRHWVTVLYAFDHPRAAWAQAYHSSRLLAQPHLAGGYHNQLTDVEHTSEDMSDALTPMMSLAPDNPEWTRRANRLVDLMEKLWTGRNERGFLQFKSTYFTHEQVDLAAAHACDTVYHPRAIQPALLYWQRTGDARIGRLVSDWMRTWVDAAAREERGKPAGILPTAIHWPDGRAGGVGESWWKPENYESPLYDFPSAMGLMLNTLVQTAVMTGDATFLEPLRTMAAARLEWLKAGRPTAPEGSRLWCAAHLTQIGGAVAKYRAVTGDTGFDALLREERDETYGQFRLAGGNGSTDDVAESLGLLAGMLRVNFPAYTQEVRFTDRVMRFPVLYQAGWMTDQGRPTVMVEGEVHTRGLHGLNLLYNTVTGDPGDSLYFPINAVKWRTSPREFAALVTATAMDRFAARLFHFGSGAREFDVEFLQLKPGAYRYTLVSQGGGGAKETRKDFTIAAGKRSVALSLPPGLECVLTVAPR